VLFKWNLADHELDADLTACFAPAVTFLLFVFVFIEFFENSIIVLESFRLDFVAI
jgi:hypothetical protein